MKLSKEVRSSDLYIKQHYFHPHAVAYLVYKTVQWQLSRPFSQMIPSDYNDALSTDISYDIFCIDFSQYQYGNGTGQGWKSGNLV